MNSDFIFEKWRNKASQFVYECHRALFQNADMLSCIIDRGLTLNTVKKYLLGLNSCTQFPIRNEWGLPVDIRGKKKHVLPPGHVVPIFNNFTADPRIEKIKIYRSDYSSNSIFNPSFEVSGSKAILPFFGDPSNCVAVLVSSELDAMLLEQEIPGICCVTTSAASARPDSILRVFLKGKQRLLLCLDFDEAGKREFAWWKLQFHNSRAWPAPSERSIGDEFVKHKINLKEWYLEGLNHYD